MITDEIMKQATQILLTATKEKYNIFTSQETYSIYKKLLEGNNTYSLLGKNLNKDRDLLAQQMACLLKTKIVKVKPHTGKRGIPAVFVADREAFNQLLLVYLKDLNFSSEELQEAYKEFQDEQKQANEFLSSKENFTKAKNFSQLFEELLKNLGIVTNPNAFSFA